MRDRIYKAKRKNWKELPKERWWVEGAIFEEEENSYIITNVKITDEWEDGEIGADVMGYLIDPETICEPTGLTDKNGKKIFEGDIISVSIWNLSRNKSEHIGVVKYDASSFVVQWIKKNDSRLLDSFKGNDPFGNPMSEIEVIGNIFDNPEPIGENDG